MIKIFGINTVYEALLNKRVKKVYLLESFSNQKLLDLINKSDIEKIFLNRNQLANLVDGNHQGIVALVKEISPISLETLINKNKENKRNILIMLDGLKDPHNLGSIIRSADIFNAKGIIYKKKSSVSINDTVEKVSTGAINYVPIAEVSNLNNAIKTLKENGYWIVGFESEGSKELSYIPKDLNLCIVIGSEGEGISRLVKQNCDMLYKIPMQGHGNINSLNASIACAIALYELNR